MREGIISVPYNNVCKFTSVRSSENSKFNVLEFGGWRMQCERYEVINSRGISANLTIGQFELLQALLTNPGRVLNRDFLLSSTHKSECESFDRAIDIQIGRLRKKLEDDHRSPKFIKTVRGIGYMFIADVRKH